MGWVIFGVFVFVAVVFIGFEIGINYGMGAAIGFICGLAVLVWIIWYAKWKYDMNEIKKSNKAYEERKAMEKAEIERQRLERNRLASEGKWQAPAQLFADCEAVGIESLSNDFYVQKVTLIVKQYLSADGIDEQYWPPYLSSDGLRRVFRLSKDQHNREKHQQRLEQEQLERTPTLGTPDEAQQLALVTASAVKPLYGVEKRIYYYNQQIQILEGSIDSLRTARNSLDRYTEGVNSGKYLQKEGDWAIAGGIASGIAGPGAGVMAALDMQNHNNAVQQHNTRAINLSLQASLASDNISETIGIKRKMSNELSETIKQTKLKVVLPDSTESIFEQCLVTVDSINSENGLLCVSATIDNAATPNVPDNTAMVVDGTLTAKIYDGDLFVGEAILPLPQDGIPCNESSTITGLCEYSLPGEHTYRAEITPNNLWLMEA